MKTFAIFFCVQLTIAALHAQNVLMPGAFTRKLGLDASTTRNINPQPNADEIHTQQVMLRTSRNSVNLTPDSTIIEMMNQVDTIRLYQIVKHLQDYVTRYAYLPQADSAGKWIYEKLDSLNNLVVEKQYFPFPNGDSGFNVIATLVGTKYPDEYVIIGAHYDSWSTDITKAPGANDDGVGVAGVLEAARIMSQYSFDRSIIFACWTMEEINLGGSGYFASQATGNKMKILGYFNLDCGGYLKPGNPPMTCVMHHLFFDYLVDFYAETCSIYLPDFIITQRNFSLADNFSFTINGYQGIWNFEDPFNFSPYNHTPLDKLGQNVNSFNNLSLFVKADIANLARMADVEPKPLNLRGDSDDGKITLTWRSNDSVDHYNIYRDSLFYASSIDTSYNDVNVTNGEYYSYYITSVFSGSSIESEGSSPVRIKPRPPITLPFSDDFESGDMYWDLEAPWGLEDKGINHYYCLSDSPGGNYEKKIDIWAYLASLNLVGYASVEISFMAQYKIQGGDAIVIVVWDNSLDILDVYSGNQQNWIQKTISLNDYLGKPDIHFCFLLDSYIANKDGIYIDDFTISGITGITPPIYADSLFAIRIFPNPITDNTTVEYQIEQDATVVLTLFNYLGQEVEILVNEQQTSGKHQEQWNATGLPAGMYYYHLQIGGQVGSGKIIKW